jgi:hypothetical protein
MSQENVEVVRRMYEAFHAADTVSALACFDADVVVDFSRRPDGRVGHGREYLNQIITRGLPTAWVRCPKEGPGVCRFLRVGWWAGQATPDARRFSNTASGEVLYKVKGLWASRARQQVKGRRGL